MVDRVPGFSLGAFRYSTVDRSSAARRRLDSFLSPLGSRWLLLSIERGWKNAHAELTN
jgi:hypothetical protein